MYKFLNRCQNLIIIVAQITVDIQLEMLYNAIIEIKTGYNI